MKKIQLKMFGLPTVITTNSDIYCVMTATNSRPERAKQICQKVSR